MKTFFLFILLFLLSCQRDETNTSARPLPKKVINIKDEIGSFTFVSSVRGIEIKGDGISRQGDMTTGEDLKVIEKSSSKVIDDFPMKVWGKVGFKVDQEIVYLYPLKDSLEITYKIKDKKIIRTTNCNFKSVPEKSRYDLLIEQSKSNPEIIVPTLFELAKNGDKQSYDFFMKPDAGAKAILKNTTDGATSILKILNFMSKNGCKWI